MSRRIEAQNVKAMVQEPRDRKTEVDSLAEPLTTSSGQSDSCGNPFCESAIDPLPDGYRRTMRRYCSDRCRMDAYALRRAKVLLNRVGVIEFHRLLDRV